MTCSNTILNGIKTLYVVICIMGNGNEFKWFHCAIESFRKGNILHRYHMDAFEICIKYVIAYWKHSWRCFKWETVYLMHNLNVPPWNIEVLWMCKKILNTMNCNETSNGLFSQMKSFIFIYITKYNEALFFTAHLSNKSKITRQA